MIVFYWIDLNASESGDLIFTQMNPCHSSTTLGMTLIPSEWYIFEIVVSKDLVWRLGPRTKIKGQISYFCRQFQYIRLEIYEAIYLLCFCPPFIDSSLADQFGDVDLY